MKLKLFLKIFITRDVNSWLTNFAYHINPGVLAFSLAGAVTLLLVLITVSYQAIRIALVNPVKILRSE